MFILLTGGTGQVGRALLPRLLAAGHEVRCLVRPSKRTPNLPPNVPVQLALVVTQTWGFTAALSTASIIPGFIFILLVQKHLVRGLTMGLTKG